jgi:hypothetical protein
MKVVFAAAAITILAAPAYAQSKAPATLQDIMGSKTPDQIEKERATEKAYKESLKKIPDAKTPADPWGSARSADTPSAVAKTPAAKPKTKSGSTAN